MKLRAIIHGIRVGWLHFRYPPIKNDPVMLPGDYCLITDDYLLTQDVSGLPKRGLQGYWSVGPSANDPSWSDR